MATIQKPPYVGKRGTIEHPAWYAGQKGWGNRATPDVYVLDVNPNYPVGTKFIDGDRTFIYGYCYYKHQATRSMGGMFNMAAEVYPNTDAVAHDVGVDELVIEDATSAVNLWAGGYCMPRDHPYQYFRILSSTATSGGHITLKLDHSLINALDASDPIFINQHPYSKMSCRLASSDAYASYVGVSMGLAVASRYMWVQTWGPCFITGGDELLGKASNVRRATFHQDGTLYSDTTANQKQLAGYALSHTTTARSTWFIYLMIAR